MGPPRPTIASPGRGAPLGERCLTPGARNQVTGVRRAAPRPLCGGGSGAGSREAQGLGNFAETRARKAFARTREHHDTLKELEASFPPRPEGSWEVVVGIGPQILCFFFFFNLGVVACASPRGASTGCPRLWIPINFVLLLQTWATPSHARVTAPQQASRPLPAVPSRFPLAPAPFSGVRAHCSLRDPPAPSGLALPGTSQPPIVASLSQIAERSPCSYLHSRDTPWNR